MHLTLPRACIYLQVGIEFTGWPTRPPVTPLRGPTLPDRRHLPIDMIEGAARRRADVAWLSLAPTLTLTRRPSPSPGTCRGRCEVAVHRPFKRTELGKYHK